MKGEVDFPRISSFTMYKGTTQILNDTGVTTTVDISIQDFIGALNNNGIAQLFSTRSKL